MSLKLDQQVLIPYCSNIYTLLLRVTRTPLRIPNEAERFLLLLYHGIIVITLFLCIHITVGYLQNKNMDIQDKKVFFLLK